MIQKLFRQFCQQKQSNASILNGTNIVYFENLYNQWILDQSSVSQEYNQFFKEIYLLDSSINTNSINKNISQTFQQTIQLKFLIEEYRQNGHYLANLSPISVNYSFKNQIGFQEIKQQFSINHQDFNFTDADLDKEFYIGNQFFLGQNEYMTLREIIDTLKKFYCQNIGIQYKHIKKQEIQDWIEEYYQQEWITTKEEKIQILEMLCQDSMFVKFLKKKFPTAKRFGLEGCDSFISGLNHLIDLTKKQNIKYVCLGMAHRGRLNTLYNICKKPSKQILAEFQDIGINHKIIANQFGNSGDVKYHLGYVNNDEQQTIELLANPSHLETVDPLVYGKVRAFQNENQDLQALGIVIHGDASFAGQGVVFEAFTLNKCKQQSSKGLIHIVINNQIGFTTSPDQSRSGYYCTDIGETIDSPILHVNADNPEKVSKIFEFALKFRNEFQKDVIIDLIGYRRMGHNELDQPSFTQPLMYEQINKKQEIYEIYKQQLIQEQIVDQNYIKQIEEQNFNLLEENFQETTDINFKQQFNHSLQIQNNEKIQYEINDLKEIGEKIFKINGNFHRQILKIYNQRFDLFSNQLLDIPMAELLSFGVILKKNKGVYLYGQDVERGTFSQRHSVLVDQENQEKIIPLEKIDKNITISNSHLSEYGCLGFLYGYNIHNLNNLCIWEAQFGDFANGCQILIDNYICSAEQKWDLKSNIVINLPHGMEGQGPEHSSGRIERFLQLSNNQLDNYNIRVLQISNAAQYFKAYIEQIQLQKPLIMFNSKKLLKFKPAQSKLEDFIGPFQKIIADQKYSKKEILLCSGAISYDLTNSNQSKIIIEQLSPFPIDLLEQELNKYINITKISWVQYEHKNQGAYNFVYKYTNKILQQKNLKLNYIGRRSSASTATGFSQYYKMQQQEILKDI